MPDTPDRTTAPPRLAELEDHGAFQRRHIGPDADDAGRDARGAGLRLARGADRRGGPAGDPPQATPMDVGAPRTEGEALARAARASPSSNQVFKSFIGQGYYETYTPGVILRNVFQNPGLVHGVHAVPAGDLAGPARGAAQLPDDGDRPDRAGDRQRLDARRGHRRGRGDDAVPALDKSDVARLRGRRRRAAADDRRGAHARRSRSASRCGSAPAGELAGDRCLRACWCSTPAPRARCATTRALAAARCTRAAASSSPRPTCSRSRSSSRRASGARTWPSAARSASACRWASAARTRATWRCATS